MKKPTLLCILDGMGLNPNPVANAVAAARKPTLDRLFKNSPWSTLTTFGERVGLPAGQMGNSEVGHLNIGAGRVVEQWLYRISKEMRSGSFQKIPAFERFLARIKDSGTVHIVGLFSDGGVHSHSEHLRLLLKILSPIIKTKIALHCITDGRDTAARCARDQLLELEREIASLKNVSIATVVGRFYAMDRDTRWDRTEKAYQAIVNSIGTPRASASSAAELSYTADIGDEFIEPAIINRAPVAPGDAVLFWNFREDRARQIVQALCIGDFKGFTRGAPPFSAEKVLCFTEYNHSFGLPFLFAPIEITNHLGEVLSSRGLTQLRTAETEKYPHVTYFLNGGKEEEYPGETRVLVPSPRDVRTYDLKPEMSAEGVCSAVLDGIQGGAYDCIVVNFANGDMVGHTGILSAAVKAVETVDTCLGKILTALDARGGCGVIIADHGNCEQMIHYEDGSPHTAHTMHPVPCIVYGRKDILSLRADGALCDVAPTILDLMGIPQPPEMTGASLCMRH